MVKKKPSRSSNDGRAWKCPCGNVNKPMKHRFFKLPAFECSACRKKLALDFQFCLGEIEARGQSLIGEVLDQHKKPFCVAFAYAKAAEITERVFCIKNRIDPESVIRVDPLLLEEKFNEKFNSFNENFTCVTADEFRTNDFGLHKMVHMGLILRSEGAERINKRPEVYELGEIQLDKAEPFKAADVSSIPLDDFEKICENMADGIPLVATYWVGKRRSTLPYCKIYKSPSLAHIREKKAKRTGHAVVLIGAGMKRGKRFFYFLNSWGKKFCPRRNKKGETVRGGIGKLREGDLTKNLIKLSPPNDSGGLRRLQDQSDWKINNINWILMTAKKRQSLPQMLQKLRQSDNKG